MQIRRIRRSITLKLFLYFAGVLLVFSLTIGLVFGWLFNRYTVQLQTDELSRRAIQMATTIGAIKSMDKFVGAREEGDRFDNISKNKDKSTGINNDTEKFNRLKNPPPAFNGYLRFIDDIAMTDVWIIDTNKQIINRRKNQRKLNFDQLPNDVKLMIQNIFAEQKVLASEDFSPVLECPVISVGAPIFDDEGNVIAAVLLHSDVRNIDKATATGVNLLLISTAFALILAIVFASLLSRHFNRPLRKMQLAATMLSEGDYAVRTDVNQKDEIGELATDIDKLAVRLEKASNETNENEKMRRNFISNISHELRTPVTVLRGSLEALCDKVVVSEEEIDAFHNQMLNETIQLERLISDLLELSRLQNVDYVIQKTELNLPSVLNDVVRAASQMAFQNNVTVELDSSIDANTKFTGDYGRIKQMLLAVLDNAIKFSASGDKVVLKSEVGKISVIDNGCGIETENIDKLFDRFYTTRQSSGGTGLGLAIVKEIADRHNIKIEIASSVDEKDHGTIFSFLF